ncbi:hypothetical protein SCB71_14490 [Herbiconiux sp. KACC 21604]|uniref:hypothetical protein n=1 Tax=unclassified Herbiconiux TaxID=2618217 RepID=UPI0014927D23|nr:hypothetical protein [Herbiconiux sp. SALV-R1]QJU54351.1 hypothetical protein HL652_12430 [Herbiconiux sp. SALV-R1]WPO85421.1 hypothetical protein SCB71_14490 [Herbiconiux sp. KACC 21604]
MEQLIESVIMEREGHGHRVTWGLVASPYGLLGEHDATYLSLQLFVPAGNGDESRWVVKLYSNAGPTASISETRGTTITFANYDVANITVSGSTVSASFPNSSLSKLPERSKVFGQSTFDGFDVDLVVPVSLLL